MNLLDENIIKSQHQLLRSWRMPVWQIVYDIARKGLKDAAIQPLLHELRRPTFETFAKNINKYFWYRRKVSEGTKGPIEYEFTKRRVVLSKNGLPDREVWLLIRRTLDEKPSYSYFISNAPLSSRLKLFVWLNDIRWAME